MTAESSAGEIRKLWRAVHQLQSASPLERSAIKNGQVRFVGGSLRIESGGTLAVEGTLLVDGVTTVTGSFTVSGPWSLTGDGTISGDVTITGDVTATGKLTQNGPWELNGAGKITGDTEINGTVKVIGGGNVEIGTSNKVVLKSDGAGARIDVGTAVVRQSSAGLFSLDMSAGAGTSGVFQGTFGTELRTGAVRFIAGSVGPQIVGIPSVGAVGSLKQVHVNPTTGQLYYLT